MTRLDWSPAEAGAPATGRQYRYEKKFVYERPAAPDVTAIVRLHPAGFRAVHPPRVVNNLYLDSRDLRCYADHVAGVSSRQKYRLRWYGPPDEPRTPVTLERKVRRGSVGTKYRLSLGDLDTTRDLSTPAIRAALARARLRPDLRVELSALSPVLRNRYHRQYFESMDGLLRLTVDRDQWCAPVTVSGRHVGTWRRQAGTVLELKYPVDAEARAARAAQALPFRASRHSKYTRGVWMVHLAARDRPPQ